ncbi:YheC/YheD family protein [Neobacillus drentensis]|uniref:YheC/YheD family endospore coat-associated protein n=1 Tax=Neobacillus drentensis TaxID=220684 RepID=UPI0030009983
MSKDFIGIIITKALYNQILKSKDPAIIKRLGLREEAGEKNNLTPCYFRITDIAAGQEQIRALVKKAGKYQAAYVPLPKVIYNQIWDSPTHLRVIKSLTNKGIHVFNEINYLKKNKFYELLAKHSELSSHLPHTEILTSENLQNMMQKYTQLILKPDNGLIGRGILKLEKIDTSNWCLYYRAWEGTKKVWKQMLFQDQLPQLILQLMNRNLYLVQEVIPLATYKGSPFDLRVATQRNHSGNWEVKAIIGKVAGQGNFLTNIGQGGRAYSLETLLKDYPQLSHESLNKHISSLAVKIADYFSDYLPHSADLGLDIALTADGFPYFIECNFVSAYKVLALRNGELINEEWKSVFTTPIEYGRYLLDKDTHNI